MSDILETHFQRQEFNPPPMNATLDDDEDIDEADESGSVVMLYSCCACSIATRGIKSLKHDQLASSYAKNNEWWLRANRAKEVCAKLGISCGESSYYRDIYVWLPDIRWNTMPPCVECGSHAFRGNSNNPSSPTSHNPSQPSPTQQHIITRAGYCQEKGQKHSLPMSPLQVGLPSIVAGVCFSPSSENITVKEKRRNGQRDKDKKQRKPRSCKICSSQECPGRASGGICRNK
jgi:hypothetical protein